MRRAVRIYRRLLALYPAGFRERYERLLQRQFQDDYDEARSARARLHVWMEVVRDVCLSVPAQRGRELAQDARHAARLWGRAPIQTAIAIAVLAIAIGGTTGVFSVVNALLLRSLPFVEPERLALLHLFMPADGHTAAGFHRWRRSSPYLSDAGLYMSQEVNAETAGGVTRARLTQTTWNFFSLLGVEPHRGRAFVAGEDLAGRSHVAVIGYGLWQQYFGGDSSALGSTIRVNGLPLTIVGIAPQGFDYPERSAVWAPTAFEGVVPFTGTIFRWTVGRIRPDLTWQQARAAFEAEAHPQRPDLATADPDNWPALLPLRAYIVGPVREASLVLMAGVGILLLLACMHLAHVLLARTLVRAPELRLRLALGASRARLSQQLLTESLLLAFVAAVAGALIAWGITVLLGASYAAPLSSQVFRLLDWRVLSFALAVVFATALVSSAGPLLATRRVASRTGPVHGLIPAGPGRVGEVGHLLVALQMALTVILVASSFALGRSFVALLGVEHGFERRSVATMSISFGGTEYFQDGQRSADYYTRAVDSLRRVPGVVAVGATEYLPLTADGFMAARYTLDGSAVEPVMAILVTASPEYFRSIGTPVIAGREFLPADAGHGEPLALVDEAFARRFGDPSSLVGARLISAGGDRPLDVIGVVGAARTQGPMYNPHPHVFLPIRAPRSLTFVARMDGDARTRLAAARDALRAVDPSVPVFDVRTMQDRVDRALTVPRFHVVAVGFFAVLAVLLAILSVYGVASAAVAGHIREICIRVALGTTPGRVRGRLLAGTSVVFGGGAVAGLVVALSAGHHLQNLVRGAEAALAASAVVAALTSCGVAVLAVWVATRPVAQVDVADVLKSDV